MPLATLKSLIQVARGLGWQAALRAANYRRVRRRMDRRYAPKKPRGPFQTPGSIISAEPYSHGAVLHAEQGFVELQFLAPEILRVRMHSDPTFSPPFSYAVEMSDWSDPRVQFKNGAQHVMLGTEHLVCRVTKETGKLAFLTPEGITISEDAQGLAWRGNHIRWTRKLPPDERAYGLGQRASDLDLRGRRWALWNSDPLPGYARGDDPVYYSIPLYVGRHPDLAFGVLWDNPARGYVDIGAEDPKTMTFFAETGELCFYIFAGQTIADVLKHYSRLTGRMPLPPLWALGYHQSRWGYDSEQTYRELAEQFRARKLPCDALYFDIDYMDGYRTFTWDRTRFPLLPNLLADLEAQGFKSVAIIDPGIKVDDSYPVYVDGKREDMFLSYPDGTPVIAPVWPGPCQFPDFTRARMRAWWAAHVRTLLQAGFAGLWNDMNEPAVITLQRGATLPDCAVHGWEGMGNTHAGGGHNVYGMLMSRATREATLKERPDKRPFVMTRATYAGGQRYASSWTGDNEATWDHLRLSISMVLNAGLSGLAFTGPDIGGFANEPDGELFTRWMQLGSLLPYFRSHTMAGTRPQEPWSFGEPYETIIRRYLELRYQLLPYIYSVFAQNAHHGMPVVRPLFMADPSDDALYNINDAFMLGDALLAAPVVEPGATQRTVYLPRGAWYAYHDGHLIEGGRSVTVNAPLDIMPLYARAGKVIPMWPPMQYVGENPLEETRLRVYAGSGETTLYEDAGEGMAYQDGDYRWSYFTCRFSPSRQFTITWRRAGRYQPPYSQVRVEVIGIATEPEQVRMDGQAAPIWYYEDGVVEFIVKPFDEARIMGRDPSSSHAQETRVRRPRS